MPTSSAAVMSCQLSEAITAFASIRRYVKTYDVVAHEYLLLSPDSCGHLAHNCRPFVSRLVDELDCRGPLWVIPKCQRRATAVLAPLFDHHLKGVDSPHWHSHE